MSADEQRIVLFEDDFSHYPPCERMTELTDSQRLGAATIVDEEAASEGDPRQRVGAWRQTSLHYAWRSERTGSWRDCPLPWRIVDRDGRRFLDLPEGGRFFNVVLAAGDDDWRDYALELELAVAPGPAGPVVRYHTSRHNYWLKFEAGQGVALIRRDQDEHVALAAARDCVVEAGRLYACRVECDGPRIVVSVDGREVLRAIDDARPRGGIALRTDGPARFTAVKVTASPGEKQRLDDARGRRRVRLAARREAVPAPKLLHTAKIPVERPSYLHLQDVNDDGQFEIVAIEAQVMEFDYIRLARLSVFDWDGKPLWQLGEARESKYAVHGDIAFNAGDVDGDGRTEILVTRDFEILLLDGATGQVKRRTPTPRSYKGREDLYERTVGDSFLVCNLRGLASAQDLILKDRYRNLWAFTCDLQPLWHRALNTGHYVRARDVNGDGKDEVMGGYSLLDADGNTLWVVPGGDPVRNYFPGPEHCDSVLLERFEDAPGAPIRIAMAASDLGFLLMDTDGRILAQHKVGHAQNLGVGRFRPDLPGRQFAVRTFWGNNGIMNLFDCAGRPLLTRELPAAGVVPVNWLGDGSALLLGSGALFDGNLEPIVELPRGQRVRPLAWDVNGDGVDEVFTFVDGELNVYGPQSVPAAPTGGESRTTLTNFNLYGGFYL